jgi:hypothetical protein
MIIQFFTAAVAEVMDLKVQAQVAANPQQAAVRA